MEDITGFGVRVERLRKDLKISREEFARRIGTSGAVIGRYEREEITPSVEVAARMAQALSVSLDYLVGITQVTQANDRLAVRMELLETIEDDDRDRILFVFDSLLREAQTRQMQRKLAS